MKKRSAPAVKIAGKKRSDYIPLLLLLAIVSCLALFARNSSNIKIEIAQTTSPPILLVANTGAERILESSEVVVPTKTVAPTHTPASHNLPLTAQAGEWSFVIQQIDVYDSLNDKKVVPDNGLFIAFVGQLENHSAEKDCMTVRQWKLANSQTGREYDFSFSAVRPLKKIYDLSDPGVLIGTCVRSNENQRLFLVYDIEKTADLVLTFYDGKAVKLNIADEIASLPTATPSSTPTPTATLIPTAAPILLSLPITAQSDGWTFVIQSIDIYRSLDNNRVEPDSGLFIVFVGDLENHSTEKDCMTNRQWTLANSQTGDEYTLDFYAETPLKRIYKLEGPGTVFGTCLKSNEKQRLFLVYDVEESADITLTFLESKPVQLNMAAYVASLPTATPLPTDTPPPTATPAPTATPTSAKAMVTAGENTVNIRFGPSTDYEVIGALEKNQSLEIVGRNADSSWWQVSTSKGFGWIAASVVTTSNTDNLSLIPVSTPELASVNTPISAYASTSGRIAFQSGIVTNDVSGIQIYAVNLDGTDLVRLTNNVTYSGSPAWSPDGQRVAFQFGFFGDIVEIYAVNVDGSNQIPLTNNSAYDGSPAWSPDGQRIVFESDRDGNREVYVMNADGTNQTRLTFNEADDSSPTWSPDGKLIAFASERDGGGLIHPNQEIYIMKADGTNQARLTFNEAVDDFPAWSPDGQKIAFTSDREGNREVYIMNADGTSQTRLTYDLVSRSDGNSGSSPAWSPSGKYIAFMSGAGNNAEIYVMNADGTNQTRLTKNNSYEAFPVWSPSVNDSISSFAALTIITLSEQPSTSDPTVCNCTGDIYNCPDFVTHKSAQECYEYCLSLGRGDIHELDREGDGLVCESLP